MSRPCVKCDMYNCICESKEPGRDYRVFLGYALATCLLIRWFVVTTNCIITYNGGRVIQCSYEPFFKAMPSKSVEVKDERYE